MNRQFHNNRQPLTVTDIQGGVSKLFHWSNKIAGHMINIKLEEKSYKNNFKAVPDKTQQSSNQHRG